MKIHKTKALLFGISTFMTVILITVFFNAMALADLVPSLEQSTKNYMDAVANIKSAFIFSIVINSIYQVYFITYVVKKYQDFKKRREFYIA